MSKVVPTPVVPPVTTMKQVLQWTPEQCADAMRALTSMPGWTLLVAILGTQEIATAQKELESGAHKSLAEVANLQYKITVARQLLSLPEAIIRDGSIRRLAEAVQQDNELDPYERIQDEIDPSV